MPHGVGSGRDFFANTNNLMVDPERAPVLFHVDSATTYRRDRVVELIGSDDRHSVASNARIQGDTLLNRARRLVPVLLEDLRGETPMERAALTLLEHWNRRAATDAAACSIFFSTYREAILGAVRDEVDEAGLVFLTSFRYFTNGVDSWFDDPDHPVWDDRATPERETRAEALRAAFGRALRWLQDEFESNDPSTWAWGRLHTLRLTHALGSKVDKFNLPDWPAPGANASVWKADFDMSRRERPFQSLYGPIFRMIVDLADIEHAYWIVDTGSSGWPGAPHYGNQHPLWRSAKLAPMVSDWEEIERDAVAVLTLR
jgi:penicillin amidase